MSILSPADLALLQEIYLSSFPQEERRPWAQIVADTGRPRLMAIRNHQGEVCGLLTAWTFSQFVYIEHFAVSAEQRGTGIGGEFLRNFVAEVGLPVVLEVERPEIAPEPEMSSRRIAFYERNGFVLSDFDYIQPPYADGLPEVPLRLMSSAPINPHTVAEKLHREVYGRVVR